ncbi:MAG: hypothetical protein AAGM22_15285 [Acidobacteriota bacterium]
MVEKSSLGDWALRSARCVDAAYAHRFGMFYDSKTVATRFKPKQTEESSVDSIHAA